MKEIRGVLTAMATPFDEDGAVDHAAALNLAAHLLEHGSHGLVVGGTTGECPPPPDAAPHAPGHEPRRPACALPKAAAEAGADASLVVAPYYNKPNAAGLRAHFESVAAAVPELPVGMYNIRSRVVINMPPTLLAELGAVDNIIAVKQANDDELGPIDGLSILAGNDNPFLRVLEFDGAGGITVASHVAGRHMREMWDAAQAGDIARAREIDAELIPLYEGLSVTTNPIPIKAALEMLGLASERMRLPLVPADAEQRAAVRAALEGLGLPLAIT